MKNIIQIFFFAALIQTVNAQVKTNFSSNEPIDEKGKFLKKFQGKNTFKISAMDINELIRKEATTINSREAKPFRIAEPVSVNLDIVKEADWVEDSGFSFDKFTIVAIGAKTISLNFDIFYLPTGSVEQT